MDIDDILREVDPTFDSIPEDTRDLQALTRAWVAERSSPELLEYATPCHFLPCIVHGSALTMSSTHSVGRMMACLSE